MLTLAACGSREASSAFNQPTAGTDSSPAASATTSTSSAGNTASAPGVTPTSITIGEIVSKTNLFDPTAFVGPAYGLQAFVNYTNDHGGIHGRKLILKVCNDQGQTTVDETCAHTLIDNDHVFALVANAAYNYAGASYVNSQNVPDIGAQPIDNAYNTYKNLFDVYGEAYPRNGKVGYNGQLYAGTETYHYFKTHFPKVPLKAGVVEYAQNESERYGASIVKGLKLEGYSVVTKVVSLVLPDFNSVAIAFKHAGVNYVYDALSGGANVQLCDALDHNNVTLTAKVLTAQSWVQSVGKDYASAPKCRNELWVTGDTRNYEDTQYPQVAAFRQQMSADGNGGASDMSEWALEGWAGALWFDDAATSCGADVTRSCIETYMNRPTYYTGHGLLTPRRFVSEGAESATIHNCLDVARWVQSKNSWVTQTPTFDCATVHNFSYPAS
jgi:branched-chain amino acid transport system substrate-binding protein